MTVKNRVYDESTQKILHEILFGAKPDFHHIKKIGALACANILVSLGTKKDDVNVKIGFVFAKQNMWLGATYFPDDHVA